MIYITTLTVMHRQVDVSLEIIIIITLGMLDYTNNIKYFIRRSAR